MLSLSLRIALAASYLTLASCAEIHQHGSSAASPDTPVSTPTAETSVPVIRHGRYTLVELIADDNRRDLMQQVIDLTVPAAASATVGDALHYVLRRSGYRLCDERADTAVLYALPLPAAHEHLGPITLREALQLLAGPRWTLQVNDETREACFVPLHKDRAASAASSPTSLSSDDPAPWMDADPINDPAGEPK